MAVSVSKDGKILIVGAGCFGISTALHLLRRGFRDVTILDKSEVLPAPDAASTDINKIVRSSYTDEFYARFGREAIELWKNSEEWDDIYHESGVLVLGTNESGSDQAYENDHKFGARVRRLDDIVEINSVLPAGVTFGTLFGRTAAYFNADGGWAAAADGIAHAMRRVKALGGHMYGGKQVVEVLRKGDVTSGVQCSDGSTYHADLVIIAVGAWGPSAFANLNLKVKCLATGQSVAAIQLNEEEKQLYAACPVTIDFNDLEFYTFPPNADGILKIARHASGYQNPVASSAHSSEAISTPRTVTSHGTEGLKIPKEEGILLRKCLREVYPQLAEKPFIFTRLCWYTDTPDGDWIIDNYESDPSLIIATAGSGHAYKFLPNIGSLVADLIEGSLSPELKRKFALNKDRKRTDPRQKSPAKTLDTNDLCAHDVF